MAAHVVRTALLLGTLGCPKGAPVPMEPPRDSQPSPPTETASPAADSPPLVAAPHFRDVHEEVGVDFTYDTGANGRALMVESTGGGAGWLDYDRDGACDLYLVQGGNPTADVPHAAGDRLFRNLGTRAFADVTPHLRITDLLHGQGITVGDFDNDGFDDVYVTNVGRNILWHNLGDGTFEDVTEPADVGDDRWSTSAAWADLDNDGDLDLVVCNYVEYDVFHPKPCFEEGRPSTCHPSEFEGVDNEVFENLGDGTFRSVFHDWGFSASGSKSLGVVVADFNLDRRADVFIANDVTPNHLFQQVTPGEFSEQAVSLGCAMNALGQNQASMGVACGDYDRNGYVDLYVTHFANDSNTLYANLGDVGFRDTTRRTEIHAPVIDFLGFGTVMADFNSDGHTDLFVANGHIDDWRHKGDRWKMNAQLFSFDGSIWIEQTPSAGEYFSEEHLGRAVATADYDQDGDLDVCVIHQNEPTALLENVRTDGHWLQLEFIGRRANRRGIGVVVEVEFGDTRLVQQLAGGTSYCSSQQPILQFGMGDWDGPCDVTVTWPTSEGSRTTQTGVSCDQKLVIHEPLP